MRARPRANSGGHSPPDRSIWPARIPISPESYLALGDKVQARRAVLAAMKWPRDIRARRNCC